MLRRNQLTERQIQAFLLTLSALLLLAFVAWKGASLLFFLRYRIALSVVSAAVVAGIPIAAAWFLRATRPSRVQFIGAGLVAAMCLVIGFSSPSALEAERLAEDVPWPAEAVQVDGPHVQGNRFCFLMCLSVSGVRQSGSASSAAAFHDELLDGLRAHGWTIREPTPTPSGDYGCGEDCFIWAAMTGLSLEVQSNSPVGSPAVESHYVLRVVR